MKEKIDSILTGDQELFRRTLMQLPATTNMNVTGEAARSPAVIA